jgi:hypothetical protein
VCAVEDQDDLVVATVADFDGAYPVALPVGRSYVDLHNGPEFGSQEDGANGDPNDVDDHADGGDGADNDAEAES